MTAVAGVAPCSTRACFILPMRESVPCAYRVVVPSTTDAIVIADRIFRDLFFIGLFLVIFRSQELRRMLGRANSKKI